MPVDHRLLDQMRAEASKRIKGVEFHSGSTIDPVFRVPFQSPELNLATWGGAPMGKVTRLWGGPGSTKSMNAWGIAKSGIEMRNDRFPDGMNVVYYNIENAYDPTYVRDVLGVDTGRVEVAEVHVIEDLVEAMDHYMNSCNIHIIDSATEAMAAATFKDSFDSERPGNEARAWGKAWKFIESRIDKQENLVIVIDQARVDFKTSAEKVAGGRASAHKADLQIHFRRAKRLYRGPNGELGETRPQKANDLLSGTHRIDGFYIEAEVDKGRVCRLGGKAQLIFDIGKMQFDHSYEYLKAGVWLNVITKSGSFYTSPTSDQKFHGFDAMLRRVREDGILRSVIMETALEYTERERYSNWTAT